MNYEQLNMETNHQDHDTLLFRIVLDFKLNKLRVSIFEMQFLM